MKHLIERLLDKFAQRVVRRISFLRFGDSFDVQEMAFARAAMESVDYYEAELRNAAQFTDNMALLAHAVSIAPKDGLLMEFGVSAGRTISYIAGLRPQSTIHGFDSFEGLPETWREGYRKGAFAQTPPTVPTNVSLIKGLFSDTLPAFIEKFHGVPIAFVHIDCDLYSSTMTVLQAIGPRLKAGSILVFDEFWNYPGWRHHEYKAFEEFKRSSGIKFEAIGFVSRHQQVAFVVA